jgi:hypothetical protein
MVEHESAADHRFRSDRRGVALPLALLLLVAISLLASGMLLRATTERVESEALNDAIVDLSAAEGAIRAWIASQGAALEPGSAVAWIPPGGTAPHDIATERLARISGGARWSADVSILSVSARSSRSTGGRSVASLIRVRETDLPLFEGELAVPVSAGGGVVARGEFTGDQRVRDGRDSPFCHGPEATADLAVIVGAGGELHLTGGATLEGDWERSALEGIALMDSALAGLTVRDLAWNADHRFGRYFQEPGLPDGVVIADDSENPRYAWGCPGDVVDSIRAAAPGPAAPRACPAASDSSRYVAVAIDAEQGTAVIAADHAQGVIMVLNGHLHLTGPFVFKGVILVDGDLILSGAGPTWPPSVEGSVFVTGRVRIDGQLTPPEAGPTNGARAVRYNRCAVERARTAFNQREGGEWGRPRLLGRPHGWFEVVR